MSDEQQWQPPTWPDEPTPGNTPFVAPGTASSAGASPGAAAQHPPAAGWTPPPKPGLIPLRPLTLGDILSGSFQVLRRNPRPTFGFALAVQGVITLVSLLVVGLVGFAAFSRLATATMEDSEEIALGAIGASVLATLVPGVLGLVAIALVQGILVLEVQRASLGEKQKLRQLWRRARGRLGALVGWTVLVALAVTIAIVLLAVIITLFVTLLGAVGIALGVVIGIFGGLAFIAVAVWLGTKLSLVPSVLMGERPSLRAAVARSWSLTTGYFWRTFGIQLLVSVILGLVSQIVTTPVQIVAPMLVFLLDPNGTGGPVTVAAVVGTYILSLLVVLVISSVTLVVQSACTALIYIDLRMRQEGLDLDLARFVEETHAGATASADPYLMPGHAVAAPGYGPSSATPTPPVSDSPWT